MNKKYSIEEYNPNWVKRFKELQKMLSGVFGMKAMCIEHVGSTSISGMKAKPVIDVLVIVKDMSDLIGEKKQLLHIGYECLEDYVVLNSYVFYREDEEGRRFENIHVCEQNSPLVRQFLAVREYLRTFPDEARAYAEYKEKLYAQFPDDYASYRKTKDAYLRELEQRVYAWDDKR